MPTFIPHAYRTITLVMLGFLLCSQTVEPNRLAAQDSELPASKAAETGSDEALQTRVRELLAGLDAPQLAQRQTSERELVALGTDALEHLPAADDRFSAEAKLRLRRVLQALQEIRAREAAEAKAIRLGKVSTLNEALIRLTDLSGVEFVEAEQFNRPLELNLGTQSFWVSLDTILDAADLDLNYYVGEGGQLGLMPRAPGRPSRTDSAAYTGIYRLETTAISARRDFSNPSLNGLVVETGIAWEPRIVPIGLSVPLDTVTAMLDDGQRIKPEAGQIEIGTNSEISFSSFSIRLPLPTGDAKTITSLSGTIRSILPGANEHFIVKLDQKHEPETVGDVTFFVEDVRLNGSLHEVRVEVAFENAGNGLESHRQWIFENPVYVTAGDDPTPIQHLGLQTYRQSSDRVGIGYLFDLGENLEGKNLHYKTPISIIQDDSDFVMRNIQLP